MTRHGLTVLFGLFAALAGMGDAAAGMTSACRATAQAVDYGALLRIPPALVKEIGAYRTSWQKACAVAGSVPFHDLYAQARRIEAAFVGVMDERIDRGVGSAEEAELIHTAFVQTYPGFIPAFEGSFIEYAYFRPSLAIFRGKARTLGEDEDRAFFDTYTALVGPYVLMPWYEMTWDFGGCIRMGEYDWLGTLGKIDGLRAEVKGKEYRAMLDRYEGNLKAHWQQYGSSKKLCICRKKNRKKVVPTLREIVKKTAKRPGYGKTRAALQKAAAAIKTGRIRIGIQEVRHCSGG